MLYACPRLALAILLVCACQVAVGAETTVKILSVEPDSPFNNPNGRLLKNGYPARFQVVVENATNRPQKGELASEVVGNLDTVYGIASQALELAPHEKRLVWVAWSYPTDIIFPSLPGGPVRVAGASWGHEYHAAWRDSAGHIQDQGQTVFAIGQDGIPAEKEPAKTQPVTTRQAFTIRYSGYLQNPAFTPATSPAEIVLQIGGRPGGALLQGTAPSGNIAFLAKLSPSAQTTHAIVTFPVSGHRLQEAFLLDPDDSQGPRTQRLYHLTDGKTFAFDIPAVGPDATLVLETVAAPPYVAPVPLSEMVALGEQKYGPIRSQRQTADGKPLTSTAQWAARRKQLRTTIFKALNVTPEPATTPFDPRQVSEDCVAPQSWLDGVSRAYIRRKVSIQVRPGERMNVWLLIPQGIGPFPAIIALHQTVPEGKDEPVGLGGFYYILNYGPFLTSRGFVVVAPDSPTVGERVNALTDSAYQTTAQTAHDPTWSLMGERLHDHIRVLDYLQTLPFVDGKRIGAIGHSLGGESTMMLTAMDDRITAAALSCGFTLLRTFEGAADIYAPPHSAILSGNFRKLLQVPIKERKLPFDFDDCMALWAPRPVFMHDVKTELWANAVQVAQAAEETAKLYRFLGADGKFYVIYSNQTHSFPEWVQPDAFDWLEYWLNRTNTP
jgi:dienelactone hydrolase